MNAIKQITPEMFPELRDGLLRELDPRMNESGWRRCFVDLADPEYGAGFTLTEGGRIVGLLGAIYSDRTIQGCPKRFCNVHSWYVQPEYRGRSLLLMREVLKLSGHTVTDFSPTRSVVAISRRLGFKPLDSSARMLLPAPRVDTQDLVDVDDSSVAMLSEVDQKIYRDHRSIGCGHVVLGDKDGYCYTVFSRIDYFWFSYCCVHYISDRRRFVDHQAIFRTKLMEQTRTRLVLVDSRLLDSNGLPRSIRVSTYEKLFRPAGVAASDVDGLYSDAVNLGLSSIPYLRSLIAGPLRKHIVTLRRWSARVAPGLLPGLSGGWSELVAFAGLVG